MPTHEETYARHAREYEALVSREDYQGNILKAIREIIWFEGLTVIDLGAGTGRLACLLAPYVQKVFAFDISAHMLSVARDKLKAQSGAGWLVAAADHRRVPVRSGLGDLIVSGWSVSYIATRQPEQGRIELEAWLAEAKRLGRPGGRIILLESLGTGNEAPVKLDHLRDFYAWLDEAGFDSTWIRTDYKFESVEMAAEIAGFFFGDDLKHTIEEKKLTILPECTGVWWLEV